MIYNNQILFIDDQIILFNKPPGLLSQKDKSRHKDVVELLLSQLQASGHENSFLAPVHRLDRNTSGVLLLARTPGAAAILAKSLKNKEIMRRYFAIVKGHTEPSKKINLPLLKDPKNNQSQVSEKGKNAITHFKLIEKMANTSLLDVSLETGRSHQIRVHLAHKGHPLIGDRKYGKKPWSSLFPRPALHAHTLQFPHPLTKERKELSAPLPQDIKKLLLQLKD